ncbi:D-2-hydroxyacid dehydrogenase [Gracilibacillus oryzae]|uniref:D-2-hydroxyacid dehydrogenase n=1 Tax=Gracilibacillus oryzae TaxID=1672701 RepID=A0A7C8GRP3_9BACI|nr:D-2-hydroxyacid dehydrogenase [Gracilibacillus oryzae]KAB8127383.1 D-2-hydroxyacid dehydrogenase [Gracilibacillus oryzae]
MNINKIIFVSPLNHEMKQLVEKHSLKKEIRFLTEEELSDEQLEWADALVTFKTSIPYDYSKVKWVHSLGAGVDNFTYKKEWNSDVILTRTITSFGQRISEYCLSYLLKDLQYHDQFQDQKQKKHWQPATPKMLKEAKVMIYGTGAIGLKVAEVLSSFGMEVYGVSLSGKKKEFFQDVYTMDSHLQLLPEIDYLINTLPLTEETETIFNETIFEKLSQVGFINVGRGESVSERDLLQALNQEQVRFAVLDVFTDEPLSEDHAFWQHPNISITPHISAVTTAEEAVECFVDTLRKIEGEEELKNRVDVRRGY